MAAQEKEWHSKFNEEQETVEELRETCKKLRTEKSALEVKCVLFLCYLHGI